MQNFALLFPLFLFLLSSLSLSLSLSILPPCALMLYLLMTNTHVQCTHTLACTLANHVMFHYSAMFTLSYSRQVMPIR